MAKWTGEIKRVKRWFRSDKLLVQFRKEPGDHNPPKGPELYWCEVDGLRLDIIAFDLQCRRNEVNTLTEENQRLRSKLVSIGSDPKIEVRAASPMAADELAARLSRIVKDTAIKFIGDHAHWIHKPDDVDLRRAVSIKEKFPGGYQPEAMPEGSLPPKGR